MEFKHIRNGCLLTTVLLLILASLCAPATIFYGGLLWSIVIESLNMQKVDFYGTVLDLDEKPVADAEVMYEKSALSNKKGKTVTNTDGSFEIHAGRGRLLYIRDIVLQGCEFSPVSNKKISFTYTRSYIDRHSPDKTKPVVFHLRRKHKEAVILQKIKPDIVFKSDQEEKWFAKDFVTDAVCTPTKKDFPFECVWDWEATGEKNWEKREWTIHIKMNGENAGIQIGDELLYEAPADGYAKELVMTFKYDKPIDRWSIGESQEKQHQQLPKHLYLRLRNPGLYARLDLKSASVLREGLWLRFEGVVNPYGSRSLEPLLSIYDKNNWDEITDTKKIDYIHLSDYRDEAIKAMKEQRLAPRPPFEQWIKEGKAIY